MHKDTQLKHYANNLPILDLESFLSGKIRGYGVIQDRFGIVKKRFEFDANCTWQEGVCYLNEVMTYDDGIVDKRTWTIKKNGLCYTATTKDVVDEAEINISGNAMRWNYKINIPYKNKKILISCDDWMYLLDDTRMINKNIFRKFGFRVGELVLFMQKYD